MLDKLHELLGPAIKPVTLLRRPCPLRFESLEGRDLLAGQIFQQIPVELSDLQQIPLELVNNAQVNPEAEAARRGVGLNEGLASHTSISPSPKQPLAPDCRLMLAATRHSQDMIDRNYFAHDARDPAPNGKTSSERASNVDSGPSVYENIAMMPLNGRTERESVFESHVGLFKSNAGHRENMLREDHNILELGVLIGDFTRTYDQGARAFPAVLMTQAYSNTSNQSNPFSDGYLTGVVFRNMLTDNDFYSIGEGVPGMGIEARSPSGDVYGTSTGTSGGYRLTVSNGTYTVVSRIEERVFGLGTVTVADQNVKLDLMTDHIPAEPVCDLDANRDGLPSALDVPASTLPQKSRISYDTNRNSIIEPLDVLIVINAINRQSGEGEQASMIILEQLPSTFHSPELSIFYPQGFDLLDPHKRLRTAVLQT